MVRIITDSTADLGPELVARHGITVVPMSVYLNEQVFRDGEIAPRDIYALVEKTGQLPKTSAPTVADFCRAFDGPDDAIFVGISQVQTRSASSTCSNKRSNPHRPARRAASESGGASASSNTL